MADAARFCRPPAPTSSCSAPTPCTRWPTPSSARLTSPAAYRRPDRCSDQAGRPQHCRSARHPLHDGAGVLPDRLVSKHGLNVIVPDDADRAIVHRVIYEELCLGEIRDESRDEYRRIMAKLVEHGAQVIILRLYGDFAARPANATPPCHCSTPRDCTQKVPPRPGLGA